ncbi:YHYH domain-containing protein [Photobacterium phosphoreum]|nr:YHYH domain-containing protein [Photobacterium phosphoreum]PSW28810.1 YHYH domain-containing protein [Photobacterium phosphoreum]
MKKLSICIFISLMLSGMANAHSGGTNSNGCHKNIKHMAVLSLVLKEIST